MITELSMKNFKKHTNSEFTFSEGLNGIFGPNYTGKTTILYGVLYALGGAGQVPGTRLNTVGHPSGMEVRMAFTAGEENFIVVRKKTAAYLYCNESAIATGHSNVTAKIEEIIGMTVKRFKQLKYAEQKKTHALLTLGASELHKIIEELTGVDKVNKVLEKLKVLVASRKAKLEAVPFQRLEEDIQNLKEFKTGEEDAKDILSGAEAARSKVKNHIDQLSSQIQTLRTQEKSYNLYAAELGKLEASMETIEKEINFIDEQIVVEDFKQYQADIDYVKQLLSEQKIQLKQGEENLNSYLSLTQQTLKIERQMSQLNSALDAERADLKKLPEKIPENIKALKECLEDGKCQAEALDREIASKKYTLEKQACPTCERPYDDVKDMVDPELVTQLEQKLESLNRGVASNETELEFLIDCEKTFVERSAGVKLYKAGLKEAGGELKNIKNKRDALAKETPDDLETKKNEISNLEFKLSEKEQFLSKQKEYKLDLERHCENLEYAVATLEGLLKPEFNEEHLESCLNLMTTLTEVMNTLTENCSECEMLLQSITLQIEHLERSVELKEESNQRHNKFGAEYNVAKALNKYLKENRDRYSHEVWEIFMGSASEFASNCTSGAVQEIQRTDSGHFQFLENDEVMGLKDSSGAQESIMGLAVQMALAESTQCPLDVLLMDEPTADMDSEHSMAVAAMLSTKGKQVIAISHRQMDASVCNNVINLGV